MKFDHETGKFVADPDAEGRDGRKPLVQATRAMAQLQLGAGPRASITLMRMARHVGAGGALLLAVLAVVYVDVRRGRLSTAAVLGRRIDSNSFIVVALIIALASWLTTSRVIRAEFLSLREKEFVEAARAAGASDRR